jgi:hypothetical protein
MPPAKSRPNQRMIIEELEVCARHVVLADARAAEMGRLKHSITHGRGNIHGALGEIIVAERIGATIVSATEYDYDLLINDLRIDVKTKRCTSLPHGDYDCSIFTTNLHQQCDYYVFTRILNDFSQAWLMGAIRKSDFFRLARFYRAGSPDPNSHLGFCFKDDCYNLRYDKLHPLRRARET